MLFNTKSLGNDKSGINDKILKKNGFIRVRFLINI